MRRTGRCWHQQIFNIVWKQSSIRNLIRRNRVVEFAGVLATEARTFVICTMTVVAIVSHGDRVRMQDCSSIPRSVFAVSLSKHTASNHAASFTNIKLRRQMIGVRKLISTPTPLLSFAAKFLWHGFIVLKKVQ